MNNYYEKLGVTSRATTREIEKGFEKKWNQLKNAQIPQHEKEKWKHELKHIKSVLTDYHKRREYDDFFFFFHPSSVEHTTPSLATTPSPLQRERMNQSYIHSYVMSQIQNNQGNTIYSHKYQNRNGHESEHHEKIFIDKDGNEIHQSLPNYYLNH